MTLPGYLIAIDLGQVSDPTAIAVLELKDQPTGRMETVPNVLAYFDGYKHLPKTYRRQQMAGHYSIIHLERLPLGTPYTELPDRLRTIDARLRQQWMNAVWAEECHLTQSGQFVLEHPRLADAPIEIVVDQTGVGRPVVDLLRETGIDPVAITITAGDQVIQVAEREYRVPKRDLVGVINVAMQARRLRAAEALPDWPVLKRELTTFKAKISLSGHDSYGAGDDWRESKHDDLVLAVALGLWYGEHAADHSAAVAVF